MNLTKLDQQHKDLMGIILSNQLPVSICYPTISSYPRRKIYHILRALQEKMQADGIDWHPPSVRQEETGDGKLLITIYHRQKPTFEFQGQSNGEQTNGEQANWQTNFEVIEDLPAGMGDGSDVR